MFTEMFAIFRSLRSFFDVIFIKFELFVMFFQLLNSLIFIFIFGVFLAGGLGPWGPLRGGPGGRQPPRVGTFSVVDGISDTDTGTGIGTVRNRCTFFALTSLQTRRRSDQFAGKTARW